ncbi:hypothetical protein P175DRAFT_04642 [Aspergillus ochraceoroseus IBT 24754]|uniref:SH3 domain-containing protein n=1 Tax=Aspergillus ochraceoroseus IBT 24754 TaxID=1392256 RepID=A0A2T5M5D7_9EURO|nr:uncharacterized protein P175DRAFT_04642 [Aspergillus ochraceoroseus IBT 24754]PTU23758.1 hypothetical protein P175DRAFT_04642 [Aspergillus ochraceoroseus IBT 24754]
MATLNLSTNGPSITKSYQSVVNSSVSGSATSAKWALFSVSTPLLSAFQQDAGNKESVLKVQDTGEGELVDLLDEFSEGKIQFAFVKVTDTNTGLPKNVLIGWCGEGVPERTKGYFTSHLSTVSRFLHGYHVQITARSDRDLTAEGIIQKVGDASGAKYTSGTDQTTVSAPKPPVSSKPVFNPLRTGGVNASAPAPIPLRMKPGDDDGWGPDAPPVMRTNLEKVQPAYQPTKVNMRELKSEKQPEIDVARSHSDETSEVVVKGGYQPIGKVDIAAIRRQAREAGNLKDDRPEPVKGAYEPVGKVDIAAIRARAQKPDDLPGATTGSAPLSESTPETLNEAEPSTRPILPSHSGRLTSLPKPKVSNKLGGGSTFLGTKPPLPNDNSAKASPSVQVGSASRTFADQGGKTPAQLWAERKARERGQESNVGVPPLNPTPPVVQSQHSGSGEWKSSYSGKTWAPVQTTHTGKSVGSSSNQAADFTANDIQHAEPDIPQQSVNTIRDQLLQVQPKDSADENFADTLAPSPLHGSLAQSIEPETFQEPEVHEVLPPRPQPPRSPTPPSPVRDVSPIRVAMPVGSGTADIEDEHDAPLTATHVESSQQELLSDKDLIEAPAVSSAASQSIGGGSFPADGIKALVQYEYEKAEDNEIDLREGEYVTEIEMVDKDWWLGLNTRGERGLFPSNYVELVKDDPHSHPESDAQTRTVEAIAPEPTPEHQPEPESEPAPSSGNRPTAKALYDYEAAEDNELSFPEGAEIKNIVSAQTPPGPTFHISSLHTPLRFSRHSCFRLLID